MDEKQFNMWGSLNSKWESTDRVVATLNEQGELLEKLTDGKVRIKLNGHEIKFSLSEISAVVKNLPEISMFKNEYDKLEDIGKMYKPETVRFDICNDDYRFTAFTLKIGPYFPIGLDLDEDIISEDYNMFATCISKCNSPNLVSDYEIKSYDKFRAFLETVPRTRKVTYIINKLRKM
jgi:hypothetical protein